MNGMKAKAERMKHAKRLTAEGLPRDANAWTPEDWRDLYLALEVAKAKIAKRHQCTSSTKPS